VWLAGANDLAHLLHFGYVTDGTHERLMKLDVRALKPVGHIDLSSHQCVPQSSIFLHTGHTPPLLCRRILDPKRV